MIPPRRKVLPSTSPDLLKRLIPTALSMKYEGIVCDEVRPCPHCNCDDITRYDTVYRTFCITIVDGAFRPINVRLKRFRCKRCSRVFDGKEPFYDGCNNASPIVDLCLALASSNPYKRVESILMQYRIQVDRDTVKNYTLRFGDRVIKYAGIPGMDDAKIGVNILRILFGVESVEELRKLHPHAKYDSCEDETYPRVKGAKKALADQRYVKKQSRERQPSFPESFTLVASYMNHLRCFASISSRKASFIGIVTEMLARPLKGSDAIITDGSECYDNVRSYRCLWHKMKNFFALDPFLKGIMRSGEEVEKTFPPWIISQHMQIIYSFAKEEYLRWLKERYPNLVDKEAGKYTGALTTNAMEGGNWRLKYELRADYERDESIEGRCILVAIRDSTKTFRNGRPDVSFAAMNSGFEYGMVMGRMMMNQEAATVTAS